MKRQSFEVCLNSVISFVFVAFANHEYCVTVLVTSLTSSLYRQAHKLHSNSYTLLYYSLSFCLVVSWLVARWHIGGETSWWRDDRIPKNQGYLFKVYSVLVMTFFRCGIVSFVYCSKKSCSQCSDATVYIRLHFSLMLTCEYSSNVFDMLAGFLRVIHL